MKHVLLMISSESTLTTRKENGILQILKIVVILVCVVAFLGFIYTIALSKEEPSDEHDPHMQDKPRAPDD